MIICPNCGDNLIFHIETQDLYCKSCSSHFDPYEHAEGQEATEDVEMEVQRFICPSCGGEIYSLEQTAAGFCIYCGASNILKGRLDKEKKPDYIIPFQITREQCKKKYKAAMQNHPFAPSELTVQEGVDEFRGIYMPYWVYYVRQGPEAVVPFCKKYEYLNTEWIDHYQVSAYLDCYYKGMAHDASSAFEDSLSERISPYRVQGMKHFVPGILSGFYAEGADVSPEVYEEDVKELANHQTLDYMAKKILPPGYYPDPEVEEKEYTGLLGTKIRETGNAMLPVWFMSHRFGNRVCYAVINGQTGKVVADVPVDIRKVLLAAFFLAIPLFFLCNLFLTIVPRTLVTLVAFFGTSVSAAYKKQLFMILEKKSGLKDRGRSGFYRLRAERKSIYGGTYIKSLLALTIILIFFSIYMVELAELFESVLTEFNQMPFLASFIGTCGCFLADLYLGIRCIWKIKSSQSGKGLPANLWISCSTIAAIIVCWYHPVEDWYYYGVVFLMLLSFVAVMASLVKQYNLYATRELPQFQYRGGDDRG